jgi:hypothetical protein
VGKESNSCLKKTLEAATHLTNHHNTKLNKSCKVKTWKSWTLFGCLMRADFENFYDFLANPKDLDSNPLWCGIHNKL